MIRFCYFDSETVSDLDIKRAGTVRYTESCESLSYHFIVPGEDRVRRIERHRMGEPRDRLHWQMLRHLAKDPTVRFVATNALFDRCVLVNCEGWPEVADISRWVCTAALCRYAGLPGGLAASGERLGISPQLLKMDDSGGIDTFCKRYSPKFRRPEQEPERWARFMEYGDQDVLATREVHLAITARLSRTRGLRHWRAFEESYFWHDQRLNQRGFAVDPGVLDSALALIEQLVPRNERLLHELTGGEISKLGSPKLKNFLAGEFLVRLPNLQRGTLEGLLDFEEKLDPRLVRILRLLVHGKRTSVAKYGRAASMVSTDGRVRGGYLYYGAHTGRPAGQGVQPTNLTRPLHDLDPIEVADHVAEAQGNLNTLVGCYPYIDPMEVLVSGIRGAVVAPPGKRLVIADYSNIESRYTSWLFGDEERLEYFRRHDAGEEELDLYEMAALRALGDSSKRQEGKSMELGLGFGMGSVKYAAVSGQPYPAADRQVQAWREAFPRIPAGWRALEQMFHRALGRKVWLKDPLTAEVLQRVDRLMQVTKQVAPSVVTMKLPSGRPLFYPEMRHPTFTQSLAAAAAYGRLDEWLGRFERNHGHAFDAHKDGGKLDVRQLVYRNHHGRQRFVHGGLITENGVQAGAGCIFREHGLALEREVGTPVMETYDEFVFEVDTADAARVADHVRGVMETPPWWCADLPLKVKVQVERRYTK